MSAQQPADQGVSGSLPTEPGTPVRVRFRKWDGSPHWVFHAVHLGSDEHGQWVGYQPGTRFARPGAKYTARGPGVGFFGPGGWAPLLYRDHPYRMRLYIDLSTVPEWRRLPDGDNRAAYEVTAVDLDLDVIGFEDEDAEPRGQFFIDDEDELAEHAVTMSYPPSLVEQVRADADTLLAAVRAGEPPYDGATAQRWFEVLDQLSRR